MNHLQIRFRFLSKDDFPLCPRYKYDDLLLKTYHPLDLLIWSMILRCISAQDDKTIKCWGDNAFGQLGLGGVSSRGENPNGPCPPSTITAFLFSTPRFLTHRSFAPCAEMGRRLPSIDLGARRKAVGVRVGLHHTCALLVRLPSWKS